MSPRWLRTHRWHDRASCTSVSVPIDSDSLARVPRPWRVVYLHIISSLRVRLRATEQSSLRNVTRKLTWHVHGRAGSRLPRAAPGVYARLSYRLTVVLHTKRIITTTVPR